MTAADTQTWPDTVSARRIRFVSQVQSGDSVLLEFLEPYRRYAVSEPLLPEEVPAALERAESYDEFCLFFSPNGSGAAFDWRQHIERKVSKPGLDKAGLRIELAIKGEQIFWRPGCAVVQGVGAPLNETLSALADFAFREAELRRLEQDVERIWQGAETHIPFTHQVDAVAIKSWPEINERTERVTRCRMRFARLAPRLGTPSMALSGPARRLAAQMTGQAGVAERLEAVDDLLEVLEDLYELANDRLSEFSYFRYESHLELWVIALLLTEVILLLWELYYKD